jgi:phenylalanyl-tRNA synthetase alpha chain
MSTDLDIERVENDAAALLDRAVTLDDLKAAEVELFGKKSALNSISQRLGSLGPDERKTAGQTLNAARTRLQAAAGAKRDQLEAAERTRQLETERLDLTETLGGRARGHLNVVTQTQERLEDVFVGMGYIVAEGPEVESDWYNFTALNLPVAHPARSTQDSAYLDLGEPESVLLRTQTSPVQIRLMESQPPPIYAIMPGRVYRRDTPDARHNPTFSQIEGLVVDRGITFGDLAGTIEAFTNAYFGARMHSRLRPYYFPFTEPSAELEVTCVICEGSGCRTCSNTGWIELGGCGMVHPNVFRNVGLDPEEWSGFAFGFGIDRLAQVRHGIADMRVLFQNDVRFIEQF